MTVPAVPIRHPDELLVRYCCLPRHRRALHGPAMFRRDPETRQSALRQNRRVLCVCCTWYVLYVCLRLRLHQRDSPTYSPTYSLQGRKERDWRIRCGSEGCGRHRPAVLVETQASSRSGGRERATSEARSAEKAQNKKNSQRCQNACAAPGLRGALA